MLRNYFKVAMRALAKQKVYAAINVFGLACGLAFCLLIILFIRDEVSYDKFFEDVDQIYRVERIHYEESGEEKQANINGPFILGPTLEKDIPEIEKAAHLLWDTQFVKASSNPSQEAIKADILFASESFFEVLPFQLMSGSAASVLSELSNVVLTHETARKHFGDQNPVGQVVQLLMKGEYRDFMVTGVTQDIPSNSTVKFDAVARLDVFMSLDPEIMEEPEDWGWSWGHTYVRLNEKADPSRMQASMDAFTNQHLEGWISMLRDRGWTSEDLPIKYALTPIIDVHFRGDSRPLYAYLLGGLALLILLMACINFTLLAVGRSAWRAREVGVRKAIGAYRSQLMNQFWSESILMSILATLLSVGLVTLFLPIFNELTGKSLAIGNAGVFALILFGMALLAGLLAGSYPALMLSNLRPVQALKGRFRLGGTNGLTRSLVVIQFALTGFLLIGSIVMGQQIRFLAEKDLGFNESRVIEIRTDNMSATKIAARLRQDLQGQPGIADITASGNTFGYRGHTGTGFMVEGKSYQLNLFPVESNHLDFFDLELVAGRTFDPARPSDTTGALIVNETLIRTFELEDPIGKQIPWVEEHEMAGVIVGVVKDYHFQALYQEVGNVILTLEDLWGHTALFVRLDEGRMQEGIGALREAWNIAVPGIPLNYRFLDDNMADVYAVESRWSRVARYAAFFAIMIACLGLLGLTALTVAGRTKEIGIRKVLGASSGHIVQLISREFGLLVGVGFLIAAPLAFFALKQFLDMYAFKITLGPSLFLIAGLIISVIAFATVGILAFRASIQDPVDSLRYE